MGRRKRGEGSVYQRKDGGWCAQYNGTYKYARSEEEARKKLYRMLSGEQETKPNNITVGKALETYFEASKANLKPRTIKRYSDVIRVHLSPSLGKVKLKDLDVARIEAVYAKKLSEGLSPATIQGIHAVLSACTKRAVRLRLVERNVCKDVELPKIEREEVEVFSPEEVRAILDEAKRDRLEALYVLALTTGMREGELIGQRVSDFDQSKGTLRIARTVYNGAVGPPKSKRGNRTISLPRAGRDALTKHTAKDNGCIWMFPNRRGNPMGRTAFIRGGWTPLLERAGVEYKRFHTCRHYVASTLLAKGLPLTAVARFMGHDERTLLKTYSHLMPDQMDAVAAAMDQAIG